MGPDPGSPPIPGVVDLDGAASASEEDVGGDPVCWASRVCPDCGRLAGGREPVVCAECGAELPA